MKAVNNAGWFCTFCTFFFLITFWGFLALAHIDVLACVDIQCFSSKYDSCYYFFILPIKFDFHVHLLFI